MQSASGQWLCAGLASGGHLQGQRTRRGSSLPLPGHSGLRVLRVLIWGREGVHVRQLSRDIG